MLLAMAEAMVGLLQYVFLALWLGIRVIPNLIPVTVPQEPGKPRETCSRPLFVKIRSGGRSFRSFSTRHEADVIFFAKKYCLPVRNGLLQLGRSVSIFRLETFQSSQNIRKKSFY